MNGEALTTRVIETARHRTSWIEAGPADGPLIVFLHGWPELGLVWRAQIGHFAALGWRCVAPDMRGYGGSSVPTDVAAYAMREIVDDMIELHDGLGGEPAVWVGHDWGSPIVWALAAHHPERCRGVASLCVPYLARGFTLPNLVALVDRELYPAGSFPVGQWDYWLYHRDQFAQSARDLEADVPATIAAIYRSASPEAVGKPASTATVRERGGWFGPSHRAPGIARDERILSQEDHDALAAAFSGTGFRAPNAWYLNDAPNSAYSSEARAFGRLSLPVLFVHAARDAICDTIGSPLAAPMRADCDDLTEVTIDGSHWLTLERPAEVNDALSRWLRDRVAV